MTLRLEAPRTIRQWCALTWSSVALILFGTVLWLGSVRKLPVREIDHVTRSIFRTLTFPAQYVLMVLRPLGRDDVMSGLRAAEPFGIPWQPVFGVVLLGIGATFWIGVVPIGLEGLRKWVRRWRANGEEL